MNSQKGITLTALVMYIIIATIVISLMAVVSSTFYRNIDKVNKEANYPAEFNKFNMFFINDVKNNNDVNIENNKVTFLDGTVYEYKKDEQAIYRNGNIITNNVTDITFSLSKLKSTEKTTKNIITVKINLCENFKETIEYVLKYW